VTPGRAAIVTILGALNIVLGVIEWTILIWVVLSWFLFFASQSSFRWRYKQAFGIMNMLNDLFTRMTYPILKPFRRLLPAYKTGGIDWSPMLLLLSIWIVRTFVNLVLGPYTRAAV
jgi:uncharacterized protein YggT (Ycf19 family)